MAGGGGRAMSTEQFRAQQAARARQQAMAQSGIIPLPPPHQIGMGGVPQMPQQMQPNASQRMGGFLTGRPQGPMLGGPQPGQPWPPPNSR